MQEILYILKILFIFLDIFLSLKNSKRHINFQKNNLKTIIEIIN